MFFLETRWADSDSSIIQLYLDFFDNFIDIIFVFLSLILLVCLEQFYIIHYNQKIRNEISKRESKNKNEKLLENNNKVKMKLFKKLLFFFILFILYYL